MAKIASSPLGPGACAAKVPPNCVVLSTPPPVPPHLMVVLVAHGHSCQRLGLEVGLNLGGTKHQVTKPPPRDGLWFPPISS